MRRLLLDAALAASLFAAALPASAQDTHTDPSPVVQAMADFRAGEYAKVVAALEDLKEGAPHYAQARYLLAESWLALGDGESAGTVFRALLEKKPDAAPLLCGLGRALTLEGKHDEALAFLAKAIKADPKDATARRAVGDVLVAQNKPVDARKEYEAAFRLDPKDPLNARAVVEISVKSGDTAAAIKTAEAFRQADPKSAMGDFLVGLARDRKGDVKEAVAAYEAALAKDPKLLDAHKNLGILGLTDNPGYKDRERAKSALDHLTRYFELGGKDEELRKVAEQVRAYLASVAPPSR